jgi:hypothetical protein
MDGDQCMAAKISVYNDEVKAFSETSEDTQCQAFQEKKTMGDMFDAISNANVGGVLSASVNNEVEITPTVECFVDNCRHWVQGNVCHASNIEVNGMNAARKSDTDCETFVTK